MDRHLIDAFIESFSDALADKVAQRLGLRPPVQAVERSRVPALSASTEATMGLPEYLTTAEAAEFLGPDG
jgi:hypothetical protein